MPDMSLIARKRVRLKTTAGCGIAAVARLKHLLPDHRHSSHGVQVNEHGRVVAHDDGMRGHSKIRLERSDSARCVTHSESKIDRLARRRIGIGAAPLENVAAVERLLGAGRNSRGRGVRRSRNRRRPSAVWASRREQATSTSFVTVRLKPFSSVTSPNSR